MTGPNGPVCACCRYACEQPDAEGRCDECHAEAALDAEALFIGAATEVPPALVRSLIVATSRTQLAAVRAQGRAGL